MRQSLHRQDYPALVCQGVFAMQAFPEEGIFGPFPDRACLARKDCLRERYTCSRAARVRHRPRNRVAISQKGQEKEKLFLTFRLFRKSFHKFAVIDFKESVRCFIND